MNHHDPNNLAEWLEALVTALMPSAIGAVVSQAWKAGLSFGERLVQILVGVCVSYFLGRAVTAMVEPEPFVAQAIVFVIAMLAYEATPKFLHNTIDVLIGLPRDVRDRFFPKRDDR